MLAALLAGGAAAPSQDTEAEADFKRALTLDLGAGGHPDQAAAFPLYRRAAERHLPKAEFNLAVLYDSGLGTKRDAASAARWYAAAAAGGERRAAYNLGLLYSHGEGVPSNADAARAWFRFAAGQGVVAARPHLRDRMAAAADAPESGDASLAHPLAPAAGDTLPACPLPAPLVWQAAAAQAGKTSYYVEVVNVDANPPAIRFEGQTDVTALSIDSPLPPGRYAWRVFTLRDRPARYSPSSWVRFAVVAR